MSQEYQDITTIGPEGLQGLKGLNFKDMSPEEQLQDIYNYSPTSVEQLQYLPILQGSSFEVNTEQNVGSSMFDNPYYTEGQLDQISDIRAKNQPGIAKLAAGFGKMAVTAGTTFISNLIGGMLGIGQGLYNTFDGDPKTTFTQAQWNNAVNTAMADVQEWAEKAMPNYYRDWELQAPWYQTVGTANFWGDKVIKNAGFMIGTAGAMAVSGGIMGGITKGLQLPGLLSKGANLATKATTLFLSSSGEAAIESLQANRDNAKRIESDIQLKSKQGTELAMMMHEDRMRKGMNFEQSMALYNKDIEKLKSDLEQYRQVALEKNIDATNSIYATQLGVLMLTNAITFSSFLRGGYKNGSQFSNIIQRKVGDNLNPTNVEFLKGLGKGTASMSLKEGAGKTGAKMAGMWLIDSASEGTQEGLQGLISTGETMYLDSQLYSLKNSVDENGNYKLPALRNVTSLMDYSFNGDNMKEITDRASAYRKALKEQFGSIEAPGWEEVFIGALTAGIGVPTLGPKHSINSQGKTSTKLGFSWAGGLREAYENTFGEQKRLEEQLQVLNNYIKSPEIQRKFEHASTAFGVNWAQQMALENGDIQSYKNGEVASIANDALFFKEFGLMDMYMSLWNDISEIVTDEDVEEFKNATRDSMTGKTPLDGKSSDEIKTMYRNKAQSYKNKINNVIESYDKWHDKLKKIFKDTPQYVEIISREAAFKEALLKDTYKRIDELQQELTSKQESLTSGEIQDYNLGIKSLEKQAIKIKEYFKHLNNNPFKIIENLEKQLKASQLYHNKANAEFIEERVKNAKSLKDVYQIYLTTDESIRDALFNKLETEGSPKVKDYIKQLNEDMLELSAITSEIDNASIPDDIKGFYKNIIYRAIQNWAEDINTPKRSIKEQVEDLEKDVENQMTELQEDFSESSQYQYLNNLLDIIKNLTTFIDIIKTTKKAATPTPSPVVPEPTKFEEEKLEGEVLNEDEINENTGENILRKLEQYLSDFIDNNYATESKNEILDTIYNFTSSENYIIGNIKQNLENNKESVFGDINTDFWETNLKDIIDSILNEFKNTYKSEAGESLIDTEDKASSNVIDNPALENIDKSNNSESSINDYLKGSQFNLYNINDLKNHKLTVYSPNSDLAFIQDTLDFLSKYLKRDATVFYAKNCVEGREDDRIIYLVVNKDDFVNLPKDTQFENVVKQNSKEYIIIGTLGFNDTNEDQQTSWNKIAEKVFNGEHSTDPYVLTDDISNKVKDITPGYIIYNEGNNIDEKFIPITKQDIEYLGGISNLKFGVQLDSEHRQINKKSGEIFHRPINAESGQVFLYVPTARPNEYIPIQIRNAYSINEGSQDYTKMVEFISNKLDTILKSSAPAETKIQEFKKLFNFFLLAKNNYIAANESGVINGVLHGKVQYLGNFNTSNLEELKNKIIEFLFSEKYLNARFKINKEILKNDPQIYLDLGLLKINAQVKVRGSQLYVYSTNELGVMKETPKEKASSTTSTYSKNKKESTLHLNNLTYTKVENTDGSISYYLTISNRNFELPEETLIDVKNIFILNENLDNFSSIKLNEKSDPIYRIGNNLYGYNSRKSFYTIKSDSIDYPAAIKAFDELEKAQTEESMKKIEEAIIKTIEEAEQNRTPLLENEPVINTEDQVEVQNEQEKSTEEESLSGLGFSMIDGNIQENLTEKNLVDSEKITNFADYMIQAIKDNDLGLIEILNIIPGNNIQEKGETLIADGFTSFNNKDDFKEKIYCKYGE